MDRDGNCYFRSISYHLCGDDSQHLSLTAAIVEFEEKNELVFKMFLMPPVNQVSFQEHATLIRSPGHKWKWSLLLPCSRYQCISAKTPLVTNIMIVTGKLSLGSCHLEVVNPLKSSTLSNSDEPKVVPHHFELFYWDGSLYDCAVYKKLKSAAIQSLYLLEVIFM